MNLNRNDLNKIYCGDCIELSKTLSDNSINLVITSPPYADTVSYGNKVEIFDTKNYVNWFVDLSKEISRFLTRDGSFILNINDKIVNGERSIYVFELIYEITKKTNLKLYDRYIWYKKSSMPMTGDKRLNDRIEYIFHFVNDVKNFKCRIDRVRIPYAKSSINRFKNKVHGNDIVYDDGTTELSHRESVNPHPDGAKPTTVFRFDTGSALRGLSHPAPFHPDLPTFFIKWLTDENDIILDPFMGGGTTAISALSLNRYYIGFDINFKYIEMSEKRIKEFKNKDNQWIKVNYD